MSDAPERIWAQATADSNWQEPIATPIRVDHFVEYVRADLSVAEAARVLLEDESTLRFIDRPGYMPRIYDWLRALTEGGE